ncbi:hypothetical protein [Ottowia caeni]|uniref:hypothetical protein n=1 Tax=Ottowia caeni TaxID=2870339 RepID=UPI003D74B1AD
MIAHHLIEPQNRPAQQVQDAVLEIIGVGKKWGVFTPGDLRSPLPANGSDEGNDQPSAGLAVGGSGVFMLGLTQKVDPLNLFA